MNQNKPKHGKPVCGHISYGYGTRLGRGRSFARALGAAPRLAHEKEEWPPLRATWPSDYTKEED